MQEMVDKRSLFKLETKRKLFRSILHFKFQYQEISEEDNLKAKQISFTANSIYFARQMIGS